MGNWGFLLLFLIIVSLCNPAFSQHSAGAKQISLSNSDVALSNDVFALFNNPSGLAQMNWREVGIYYSPAPFGFTELANGFIAYNEPFSFGSVAIGAMTYGFDLYRETKFIAGFSYNYDEKFFGGVAVNIHNVSIKNYGSDLAFYINAGGLAWLTGELRVGFSIQNLNRATFGNEDDQIPMIFNSGLSYDVLQNVSLNFSLESEVGFNPSLQCGINYDLNEYFSLRSGFANEPAKYSAGFGVNYSQFEIDYAIFTHQELGLTHQFSVMVGLETLENRTGKIRKYLGF